VIMPITKGNSGANGKMSYLMKCMAARKIANLSIDFVKSLHKKYNEPFTDKKLLQFVQKDRLIFLKNQGIKEERV